MSDDAGFQAFDSSGNVVFDSTKTPGRILGAINIAAGTAGSVTNAEFAHGEPFAVCYPNTAPSGGSATAHIYPSVSFSGTTMTYTAGDTPCEVIYGVYPTTSNTGSATNTAGFRFYNSDGCTVIDGTSAMVAFVEKLTLSMAANATWSFTVTATNPFVAYRSSGSNIGMVGVLSLVNNGHGTWTFTIRSHLTAAAAGTIYVFDVAANGNKLLGGTAGLRLFNTSGTLIFDSRMACPSIADLGEWPAVAPAFPQETTISDNFALILNSCIFEIDEERQTTSSGGTISEETIPHIYLMGGCINGEDLYMGGLAEIDFTSPISFDNISGYSEAFAIYIGDIDGNS